MTVLILVAMTYIPVGKVNVAIGRERFISEQVSKIRHYRVSLCMDKYNAWINRSMDKIESAYIMPVH